MRKYPDILNRIVERLTLKKEDGGINLDDAWLTYFFVNIRGQIERSGSYDSYPATWFFINWLVHDQLSKKNTAKPFLDKIAVAIQNKAKASDSISEIVGLHLLRKELSQFFKNFGVNDLIASNDEKWRELAGQVSRLVLEKPIIADTVLVEPGQVEDLPYKGYLAFWLSGKPGERIQVNVSAIPEGVPYSTEVIHNKDTVTFVAGLYHVP